MFTVIYETWEQGGYILLPIIVVGFWGFCLLLGTYFELGATLRRSNHSPVFEKIRAHLESGRIDEARQVLAGTPELIRNGLNLALDNRSLSEAALRNLLAERLSLSLYNLERHLPLVRVMAASAPLMGLLGTVSGLIHTFQVMTEYGSGNAVLLAHGISEALIATQSGLLLAITLILLGQRLEGRVQWLQKQVEYGLTMVLNQIYREGAVAGPASSASSSKGGS